LALDFLFLYEHIVREFENNCLIMAELERRGYTCELFQLMDRKRLRYFFKDKPKVIVTSAMYNNETLNSFVYNNVGRLNRVVNLHWEEVLSREQEQSEFYNLSGNAAKCTHICWGQAARDRIVENGVPANNAVITGAVQLDFLYPQFDRYYLSRRELADKFDLDNSKQWLCYISSFSCAWMDDKEIEELNEMTDLDFTGFKAVGARSMKVTLEWFDRLLSERSDIELIYRPHPNEWDSPPLKQMTQKYTGFHVIRDYSVKQWVKHSDLLLTWMSTAIAEVFYAGKTCLVLRPEPLYEDYDPVTYEGVDAITDYDELLRRLALPEHSFPIDKDIMTSHYDVDPERPAHIRICDLLEYTYLSAPRDLPFSSGYHPRFNLLKFLVLTCLHAMMRLGIDPHWFDFLGKKLTGTTERLMDYYRKAYVSPADVRKKIEELKGYLEA